MSFTFGIKLPGFNKKIWVNEITSKLYRDLVKSLYNNDTEAFLQQLERIVEHVSPGILQEGLNVVDKIILLLYARSICISPDLKLKGKCSSNGKEFEVTLQIEKLLTKLENISYTRTVEHEDVVIVHSVAKARDEKHFVGASDDEIFINQLASCIDSLAVGSTTVFFNKLSFEERVKIIESIPLVITSKVFDSVIAVEVELSKTKLLLINSPFTGASVVDLPVSTDTKVLLEFCRLIFNDDLNNLYKISFNLVNKANYTPEYIDGITPAEQLLYWTYFVQQAQKEQSEYDNMNKSKDAPKFGGQKIAGESPSEFTG